MIRHNAKLVVSSSSQVNRVDFVVANSYMHAHVRALKLSISTILGVIEQPSNDRVLTTSSETAAFFDREVKESC